MPESTEKPEEHDDETRFEILREEDAPSNLADRVFVLTMLGLGSFIALVVFLVL